MYIKAMLSRTSNIKTVMLLLKYVYKYVNGPNIKYGATIQGQTIGIINNTK